MTPQVTTTTNAPEYTNEDTSSPGTDDTTSVTSSLTVESFASLQKQVNDQDNKLSHIDLLLGEIPKVVLKGNKDNQPTLPDEDDDTGDNTEDATGGHDAGEHDQHVEWACHLLW